MPTLLKPLQVRQELLRRRLPIWNSVEFRRIFKTTPSQAKYFLETYTAQGLFTRLKKGLYALADTLPPEQEIANLLYRPSYLSFEYALAFYGMIPEMVYTLTSATTKPTRLFHVGTKTFEYLTIKARAYTGYIPRQQDNRTFLIAEPEKALVDYLYFVALGKKTLNERLSLGKLERAKAQSYAELYERPGLEKLVKEIVCLPKAHSKHSLINIKQQN